jgi:hypothetical protein
MEIAVPSLDNVFKEGQAINQQIQNYYASAESYSKATLLHSWVNFTTMCGTLMLRDLKTLNTSISYYERYQSIAPTILFTPVPYEINTIVLAILNKDDALIKIANGLNSTISYIDELSAIIHDLSYLVNRINHTNNLDAEFNLEQLVTLTWRSNLSTISRMHYEQNQTVNKLFNPPQFTKSKTAEQPLDFKYLKRLSNISTSARETTLAKIIQDLKSISELKTTFDSDCMEFLVETMELLVDRFLFITTLLNNQKQIYALSTQACNARLKAINYEFNLEKKICLSV